LSVVANLGSGVEAHPECTEADTAAEDDPPAPAPKKKKRRSHSLAHDAIKEEKLISIHFDLETGEKQLESSRFLPSPMISPPIPDM
jgi:hypothetical protein